MNENKNKIKIKQKDKNNKKGIHASACANK